MTIHNKSIKALQHIDGVNLDRCPRVNDHSKDLFTTHPLLPRLSTLQSSLWSHHHLPLVP